MDEEANIDEENKNAIATYRAAMDQFGSIWLEIAGKMLEVHKLLRDSGVPNDTVHEVCMRMLDQVMPPMNPLAEIFKAGLNP